MHEYGWSDIVTSSFWPLKSKISFFLCRVINFVFIHGYLAYSLSIFLQISLFYNLYILLWGYALSFSIWWRHHGNKVGLKESLLFVLMIQFSWNFHNISILSCNTASNVLTLISQPWRHPDAILCFDYENMLLTISSILSIKNQWNLLHIIFMTLTIIRWYAHSAYHLL